MEFSEIVRKRYATKKFNGQEIPKEKIDELFEMIRLAASSAGLQPWKIKVITDKETKEKLLPHSYNQSQVTTCSHLLVFCANTDIMGQLEKYEKMMLDSGIPKEKVDGFSQMVKGFASQFPEEHQKLAWAQRQVYIAMSNALNGAKALGFDSCPMEGFNPQEYSKILELPANLVPTVLVPVGFAADKPRPKIRYPKEDMFF